MYDVVKELFHEDTFLKDSFQLLYGDKIDNSFYVDLSIYVYLRRTKQEFYSRLQGSIISSLFDDPYPTLNNLDSEWKKVRKKLDDYKEDREYYPLSDFEREAIFCWILASIKKQGGRSYVLSYVVKDCSKWDEVEEKEGVFFNPKKITLHLTSSFSKITSLLPGNYAFYRGHAEVNYRLQPSIFRTKKLATNEKRLVNDIQVECPNEFVDCETWFERLVKMQHYGLPTRLLDVTSNPLVALYFACCDKFTSLGELILLYKDASAIRYPQSDEVSILSNLVTLSEEQKYDIHRYFNGINIGNYKSAMEYMLSNVQMERSHIKTLSKDVLLNDYFVYALKKNERIVKQDGAFVLCGLNEGNKLEELRFRTRGKRDIILIRGKGNILEKLDLYGISKASLFPEIDNVASYLREKYG